MEDIFTNIYETNIWGNNGNKHYSGSSGNGSSISYNEKYIKILKKIINDYNISTIVDLGCGDFRIGRLLYDDIDIIYTGYDTYKKVIDYNITQYPAPKYTFKHLDIYTYKENIIEGDMCILKDVIQHWTEEEIYIFLDYLTESKKFKYILLINCENWPHRWSRQGRTNKNIQDSVSHCKRKLNHNSLPLKKYNAIKIDNYKAKEISIIKL